MTLRRGGEIVTDILKNYLHYLNYKEEIVNKYQESKDWGEVFSTCVYSDVKEAQESFVDYVEEVSKTKVKDAKHLQELTGITLIDELEETLINSRYTKYFRALEKALEDGAKYKELLNISPKEYNLPEVWSGALAGDQYSSILWALSFLELIECVLPH